MRENEKGPRILVIQTAFLGDAILISSVIESILSHVPNAKITLIVRKGVESLYLSDKRLERLYIHDKSKKLSSLYQIYKQLRRTHFDVLFLFQRFLTMSLFSLLCIKAKKKYCFHTSLLSFFFSKSKAHSMTEGIHEISRNHQLLQLHDPLIKLLKPKLHLNSDMSDINQKIHSLYDLMNIEDLGPYWVWAPKSVWKTKEWPLSKWKELLSLIPKEQIIFCIGASPDKDFIHELISNREHTYNLASHLNLEQSARLISKASLFIGLDSAPLHLASAVNTPSIAIFCSTTEGFGFGPLSDKSLVVEVKNLACKPCGLHGKKECPLEGAPFYCAQKIGANEIVDKIDQLLA